MRTLSGGSGVFAALALASSSCSASGPSRSIGRGVAADRRSPRVTPSPRTPHRARLRLKPEFTRRRWPPGPDCRASRGCGRSRAARRSAPGRQVGVFKDRRARTYTAVLAVRVTSFGLLDRAEQEAGRLDGAAFSPGSRGRAPRSAGSSGSSGPCPPTATRSVATSARRGIATRRGRLAVDAVLPRADEHRARDHDRSRALRLPPDRCEAGLAADQTRRRQARPRCRRVRGAAARVGGALRAIGRCGRPGRRCAPPRRAGLGIPGGVRSLVETRTRASRGSRPRARRHR